VSVWAEGELGAVGGADELRVSSRRPDGTLRPYVTIWVARLGEEVFVRSAHGVDNGWFRRARNSGTGRLRAGGVERDVRFEDVATSGPHAELDRALHAKYDGYGPGPVGAITGPGAYPATLLLAPL